MKISQMNGILVIPNEQELEFAKTCNVIDPYTSPIAIRNRKVIANDLAGYVGQGQKERQDFEVYMGLYPMHKFLYHLQVKEGTTLSPAHLKTVDEAQDTPKTPYFLVYPESAECSLKTFQDRLDHVDSKFGNKIRIPVLDPAVDDPRLLKEKCLEIVKRGYDSAAILFRSPKKCKLNWQIIGSTLRAGNVEMISIGTYKRWATSIDKKTGNQVKVSTLCAPAVFGCKGMAHYRPWSGGPAPTVFLSDQMYYEALNTVTGKVTYNGDSKQRACQRLPKSYAYPFSRMDAIKEAQNALANLKPIRTKADAQSIAKLVDGIRHFAEEFGII